MSPLSALSLHAESVATFASATTAKHQGEDHQRTEEDHQSQGAKDHGAETTFGNARCIRFSERNDGRTRVHFPVDIKRPQRDLMGAQWCSTPYGQEDAVRAVARHFIATVHAVVVHYGPFATTDGCEDAKPDLNAFHAVGVGGLDRVDLLLVWIFVEAYRIAHQDRPVVEDVNFNRQFRLRRDVVRPIHGASNFADRREDPLLSDGPRSSAATISMDR